LSAQAKAISEVIKDFEQSIRSLRPSTRRVYAAGAKAAIRAARLELSQSCSHDELLDLIRKSPPEQGARVAPFLAFLRGAGGASISVPKEAVTGLKNWVIQTLGKQMRLVKNPSITTRRDLALIAARCATPARGTPRKWPVSCLKIKGQEVILWDVKVEEPCFALALRLWHAWRERLARPDQRRLYRKSLSWSQSKLLFPGPNGAPLGRAALHNALRRLSAWRDPNYCVTPEQIRVAFLEIPAAIS
jgi:hypothetical protein